MTRNQSTSKTPGNPFTVLGINEDADDEAIRRRFIELTREFPPDKNPEKFKEIRGAYEKLKDHNARLNMLMFEHTAVNDIQELERSIFSGSRRTPINLLELLRKCRKI